MTTGVTANEHRWKIVRWFCPAGQGIICANDLDMQISTFAKFESFASV